MAPSRRAGRQRRSHLHRQFDGRRCRRRQQSQRDAIVPILIVATASNSLRVPLTMLVTIAGLVTLGAVGAWLGGAPQRRAAIRVLIGGALALAISLAIGRLTGAAV